MALNAKDIPTSGTKQPDWEAGTYPARLVQVIDLGLQPQAFGEDVKQPAREIALTYEFVDEFMVDEDGQPQTDKPRWLTETIRLRSLYSEKATSTQRYNVLDPNGVHEGNFAALVGTPCNVTVVKNPGQGKNKGKVYGKIAGISPMREKEAAKCPQLVNSPKIFDLDEPDLEVFSSLPKYLQEKIKSNLEYDGSPLSSALGGTNNPGPAKKIPSATTGQKQVAPVRNEHQDIDDEVPY